MMMQINLYRTNARTSAAQRRRIRKMFELLNAVQMRSQHTPDRPRISRPISMSADMAKHRTDIQTRSTTNTVQHFALLRISEQLATTVIDQHHVELFRSIHLACLSRSANHRAVSRNALPSARSREHRP